MRSSPVQSQLVNALGCLILWSFTAASMLPADEPQRYALLVGVANYSHATMNKPQPLLYPEADAKAIAHVLKESGYEVDLLLGEQATGQAIRQKLDGLTQKGNSSGIVLVGLFGHGVETETVDANGEIVREGCFCPFDTTVQAAKDSRGNELFDNNREPLMEPSPASLVRLADLMKALKLSPAGSRVVLADCCRTSPNRARGRSFGAGFRAQDLPDNTSILFGCAPNEQAFEHSDWGHGAFTKCLLEEINESKEAQDLETASLVVALKKKVPQLVSSVSPRDTQTPKLFSTDSISLQLRFDDPDAVRGYLYLFGSKQISMDRKRAVGYLLRAGDRGHGLSQGLLAYCYNMGWGVRKDQQEAKRYAEMSAQAIESLANQGQAKAQVILGKFYDLGIGVPKDENLALEWYHKASSQNNALATFLVGARYEQGRGVDKDLAQAFDWYRKSSELGFWIGTYSVARAYETGSGVTKDLAKSTEYYRQSAEMGFPSSQNRLGELYQNGIGVAQDYIEATRWFRMAAERDDMAAQNSLGFNLEKGNGVAKDAKEAVKWYRRSAEQGNPAAKSLSGNRYLLKGIVSACQL